MLFQNLPGNEKKSHKLNSVTFLFSSLKLAERVWNLTSLEWPFPKLPNLPRQKL